MSASHLSSCTNNVSSLTRGRVHGFFPLRRIRVIPSRKDKGCEMGDRRRRIYRAYAVKPLLGATQVRFIVGGEEGKRFHLAGLAIFGPFSGLQRL